MLKNGLSLFRLLKEDNVKYCSKIFLIVAKFLRIFSGDQQSKGLRETQQCQLS